MDTSWLPGDRREIHWSDFDCRENSLELSEHVVSIYLLHAIDRSKACSAQAQFELVTNVISIDVVVLRGSLLHHRPLTILCLGELICATFAFVGKGGGNSG